MTYFNKIILLVILAFIITLPLVGFYTFGEDDIAHIRKFEKRNYRIMSDFIDDNGKVDRTAIEDFFCDRILFRSDIIDLYIRMNLKLGVTQGPYGAVVVGRDGWFFNETVLSHSMRTEHVSCESLDASVNSIESIINHYKDKGVDFLYMTVPFKHLIYPEYAPSYVTLGTKKRYSEEFSNTLSASSAGKNYINMLEILLPHKEKYGDLLYYKTDGHWTELSASIAYNEAMDRLSKIDSEYSAIKLDNYVITDESKILDYGFLLGTGLSEDKILDVGLGGLTPIEPEFLTDDTSWWGLQHYSNPSSPNNKNMLLIGDSLMGDPSKLWTDVPRQAFVQTFDNLYFIHSGKIFDPAEEDDYLEKLIDYYEIDTVLFKGNGKEVFNIYETDSDYRRFTSDFYLDTNRILINEQCESTSFKNGVLTITPNRKDTCIIIKQVKIKDGVNSITITLNADEQTNLKLEFLDVDKNEISSVELTDINSGENILDFEKELSKDIEFIRVKLNGNSINYTINDFYINLVQ